MWESRTTYGRSCFWVLATDVGGQERLIKLSSMVSMLETEAGCSITLPISFPYYESEGIFTKPHVVTVKNTMKDLLHKMECEQKLGQIETKVWYPLTAHGGGELLLDLSLIQDAVHQEYLTPPRTVVHVDHPADEGLSFEVEETPRTIYGYLKKFVKTKNEL